MTERYRPMRVHRVGDVDALARLLLERPAVGLLGGGTACVPEWREGSAPEEVVHLPAIPALRRRGSDSLGAAVALEAVSRDQTAPAALRLAAGSIAGPAVRNVATVGGNLVAGGCVAVALLALDATATCLAADVTPGPRPVEVPVSEALGDASRPILQVRWRPARGRRSTFHKIALRTSGGPNLAAVAACWLGPATRPSCAIAVGSTGVVPHRLGAAELAWSALADDPGRAASAAGQVAAQEALVAGDRVASAEYRRHLVGVLVQRALGALTGSGS